MAPRNLDLYQVPMMILTKIFWTLWVLLIISIGLNSSSLELEISKKATMWLKKVFIINKYTTLIIPEIITLLYKKTKHLQRKIKRSCIFRSHWENYRRVQWTNNIIKHLRTMSVPFREIQSTIIPQVEVFSTWKSTQCPLSLSFAYKNKNPGIFTNTKLLSVNFIGMTFC